MKTKSGKVVKKKQKSADDFSIKEHKAALDRLKDADPEFYKFLQNEDAELLDFNVSDDELPDDDREVIDASTLSDDEDGEAEITSKKRKKVTKKSSAEEKTNKSDSEPDVDEEDDDEEVTGPRREKTIVDVKLIEKWQEQVLANPSLPQVVELVQAFCAACERAGAEVQCETHVLHDSAGGSPCFKKKKNIFVAFNAIVRLCFVHMADVFRSLLKRDDAADNQKVSTKPGQRFRNWSRYKSVLKQYLTLVVHFISNLQNGDVICATLKHANALSEYYVVFPKLLKKLLRQLVKIWSRLSSVDTARVQAFVNLMKIVQLTNTFASLIMRSLYLAYVNNTRHVTTETWPGITFMQASFAELVQQIPSTAYQYTFVYIRQMAIHLRNANMARKKELVQAVYNWPYIQCISLWCRCLAGVHKRLEDDHMAAEAQSTLTAEQRTSLQAIDELRYPLVQIAIGTARLVASPRFYPLRLHCIRALVRLIQKDLSYFIPILPLLTDMLSSHFLTKKSKRAKVASNSQKNKGDGGGGIALKSLNLDCVLKVSKRQRDELQYKHALLESIFEQLMKTLYIYSCRLAFAEMCVLLFERLRHFIKNCPMHDACRDAKSLMQKLREHIVWLEQRRQREHINLHDVESMTNWENDCISERDSSPFGSYYKQWHATVLKQRQLRAEAEKINETKVSSKRKREESDESGSDSEEYDDDDDDDEDSEGETKKKSGKKQKKQTKVERPKAQQSKTDRKMEVDFLKSLNINKVDSVHDLVLSDDDDDDL